MNDFISSLWCQMIAFVSFSAFLFILMHCFHLGLLMVVLNWSVFWILSNKIEKGLKAEPSRSVDRKLWPMAFSCLVACLMFLVFLRAPRFAILFVCLGASPYRSSIMTVFCMFYFKGPLCTSVAPCFCCLIGACHHNRVSIMSPFISSSLQNKRRTFCSSRSVLKIAMFLLQVFVNLTAINMSVTAATKFHTRLSLILDIATTSTFCMYAKVCMVVLTLICAVPLCDKFVFLCSQCFTSPLYIYFSIKLVCALAPQCLLTTNMFDKLLSRIFSSARAALKRHHFCLMGRLVLPRPTGAQRWRPFVSTGCPPDRRTPWARRCGAFYGIISRDRAGRHVGRLVDLRCGATKGGRWVDTQPRTFTLQKPQTNVTARPFNILTHRMSPCYFRQGIFALVRNYNEQ